MKRRAACVVCCVAVGALAAFAAAQHSHDPLARPRHEAEQQNQRILMLLTGGDRALEKELATALDDYLSLGKLVRYEYRLVGLPAESRAGQDLRSRLRIGDVALPALVVLDTGDRVLGSMPAGAMRKGPAFSAEKVRTFLEEHPCEPRDARGVLAAGLAEAKATGRDAFVYLSAPS